jgi:glutaredoxin
MTDETKYLQIPGKSSTELVDEKTTEREHLKLEFEEVKANLKRLAEMGEASIETLTDLAKASQNHLVYMALAAMIKSVNESNRDLNNVLVNKHELMKEDNKEDSSVGQVPQVVNNTLNVTSTELIEMIRKKNGTIQE